MSNEECFLCEKTKENCLGLIDFVNLSTAMPESKRELRFVLEHLANCIRTKLIFGSDTYICKFCFDDLAVYDKLMVKLLVSQKRLTSRLQGVLTTLKNKQEQLENENNDTDSNFIEEDDTEMRLDDTFDTEIQAETEPDADTEPEPDAETEPDADTGIIIEEEQSPSTPDMLIEYSEDEDYSSQRDNDILFEAKLRTSQECLICGETFRTKMMLHHHINETHNKIFECKICRAVRKDEEYLELHMNMHEGKTENECRYCPKRFSRPVDTLRHMRKHWDKKGFQCEKCGERFSLDSMLYSHRLRHEAEENPLVCSICNQSFKSRKTLKHHRMTHQKDRPRHQCPLCPKSFTERYTLKMHMTSHDTTKESKRTINSKTFINVSEEHSCVICDQKFKTKDLLNNHLKDNHLAILE